MSLSEILLSDKNKERVIKACVFLIEEEIASKKGISGMAIKGVFKLVKAIKAGVLDELVLMLLPEFTKALEPIYATYEKSGASSFVDFFNEKKDEVVKALLGVTDARAEEAQNQVLKSGYAKLRGMAEKQVAAAVPRLAKLIADYLPTKG